MKFDWNFGRKKPKEEPKSEPLSPEDRKRIATMGIVAIPHPKTGEMEAHDDAGNLEKPDGQLDSQASDFIELEAIEITAPCSADWDKMRGGNRARFCADCQKEVHNLSALTREQTEQLIRDNQGHFCALIYRHNDGSIISAD